MKKDKKIQDTGWGLPKDWTVLYIVSPYKKNSSSQRFLMQNVKSGEMAVMVMDKDLVPSRVIWIDRM